VALRPDKSCEGSAQARSESDFPPTSEDIPPAIWDSHSHIDDCIVLLNYQKANDKRQTCAGLPKEESGKRKAESGKQKVGGGLSGGAGGIAWSIPGAFPEGGRGVLASNQPELSLSCC